MEGEERTMRQAFIRHLIANVQCVNCGERYARNDIYVLGHHEDVWVSAVVCSRCGTQGLVFATIREDERFDVRSKATAHELATLKKMPALTIDDVLDVHAFLKEFDGDVTALFEQSTSQDGQSPSGW
jgi:hypothetical protein